MNQYVLTEESKEVPSDRSLRIDSFFREHSPARPKELIKFKTRADFEKNLLEETFLDNSNCADYLEILTLRSEANLLFSTFFGEISNRMHKILNCPVHSTIVTMYSYTSFKESYFDLEVSADGVLFSHGSTKVQIPYAKIKGLIVGPQSSNFKRNLKEANKNLYYFSILTQERSYDLSLHFYQSYKNSLFSISRHMKIHDETFPEITGFSLSFYLVKLKVLEEAKKRYLTISQLFILSFLVLSRKNKDFYRENRLLNLLNRTLDTVNRLYNISLLLQRKYDIKKKPQAITKRDREFLRITKLNIRRYFNLQKKIGGNEDDFLLASIINIQSFNNKKSNQIFEPNLKRLFRVHNGFIKT